jgi:hypothetical protein
MTILTRSTKHQEPVHKNESSLTKKNSSGSFEETYRSAYTHGLEKIYAIENVDLKTVRPLQVTPKAPQESKQVAIQDHRSIVQEQLELDLGLEFRGWIDSFVLEEPIQVLGLSRYAEKCMLEHGKFNLRDLLQCNFRDFVFLKGMGQGHIDEIQETLHKYLEGKPLTKCSKVDFSSWLRTLVGSLDRKKVFTCLEIYELEHLVSLSPMESMEARRLTLEKRQEWIHEVLEQIKKPEIVSRLQKNMQMILAVFARPWIRKRGGLVTKAELNEYIQRISVNPVTATSAMRLFQEIYFEDKDPLEKFLPTTNAQLFYADPLAQEQYEQIIKKALTYFYSPTVTYKLHGLIEWIEREYARSWTGYSSHFVEKVLTLSPLFAVYKNARGILEICLK